MFDWKLPSINGSIDKSAKEIFSIKQQSSVSHVENIKVNYTYLTLFTVLSSVGPDVGIKSSQIYCNFALNSIHKQSLLNFQKSQKITNLWATFVREFVAKSFQELPNLVAV